MNLITAAGLITLLGGALSLYANARKSQAAAEQAMQAQQQAEKIAGLAQENMVLTKKLAAATTGDGSYIYFEPFLMGDTIQFFGKPVGGTPIYDVVATFTDSEAAGEYLREADLQKKQPNIAELLAASRRKVVLGTIPTHSNAPKNIGVSVDPGIYYSMANRDELTLSVEIWSRFGPVSEMMKITKFQNPPIPTDPTTGKPLYAYASPFRIDVIYKVERDGETLQEKGVDRLGTGPDGKPSWNVRPLMPPPVAEPQPSPASGATAPGDESGTKSQPSPASAATAPADEGGVHPGNDARSE